MSETNAREGRKPFAGQPPRYVGPRRTDRPHRQGTSRGVSFAARNPDADETQTMRSAPPCPSDDERDALFLAALREDEP